VSEESVRDAIPTPSKGSRSMETLILLGIFVLWIVLQVWVLPKAGVPT
jgi:hypothetical protein